MDIKWRELGIEGKMPCYIRDLWTHETLGPAANGVVSVMVSAADVKMFRISRSKDFPLPPIIVADSYLVSLRGAGSAPQTLSGAVTFRNRGSAELPAWRVRSGLPGWLSVTVMKNGNSQSITSTVRTAGLSKGLHHTVVRLDNTEPVSGRPMSAIYYDVDVEIPDDIGGVS